MPDKIRTYAVSILTGSMPTKRLEPIVELVKAPIIQQSVKNPTRTQPLKGACVNLKF